MGWIRRPTNVVGKSVQSGRLAGEILRQGEDEVLNEGEAHAVKQGKAQVIKQGKVLQPRTTGVIKSGEVVVLDGEWEYNLPSRKHPCEDDKKFRTVRRNTNNRRWYISHLKYLPYLLTVALCCLLPVAQGSSPAVISGPQSPSTLLDLDLAGKSTNSLNDDTSASETDEGFSKASIKLPASIDEEDFVNGREDKINKQVSDDILGTNKRLSNSYNNFKTKSQPGGGGDDDFLFSLLKDVASQPEKSNHNHSSKKRSGSLKRKSSQHLLDKLKTKSLALKADMRQKHLLLQSQGKETRTGDFQFKAFPSNEKIDFNRAAELSDYLLEGQEQSSSQLEIKTESPPSPDQEEQVYKDCPMFANGELVGVRPHGAQWSDGDDQCELCACTDGEKRCYYHYCSGPKIGFITPPSAETPTTTNGDNNMNLLKAPFNLNPTNNNNNNIKVNTDIETNNILVNHRDAGSSKLGFTSSQNSKTNAVVDTRTGNHFDETNLEEEEEEDEESSGTQPWSLTDDEDTNYEYNYNGHVENHLNVNIVNQDHNSLLDNANQRSPPTGDTSNSRVDDHQKNHPDPTSQQNHVVLMENYGDSFEAFDPMERFETVNSAGNSGTAGKGSLADGSSDVPDKEDSRHGPDEIQCDRDCGKSCPYGYKITPGSGCPTCKCLKCRPLVNCRLYCPSGYLTDTHGCPVCNCTDYTPDPAAAAPILDHNNNKVHHTLHGIQDTRRFSTFLQDSENKVPGNSGVQQDGGDDQTRDYVHKNDVMYDRHDVVVVGDDKSNDSDDDDVVGVEPPTTTVASNKRKHKTVIDPHNHFYDNAFDILKDDELSILRDEDTGGNSDDDGHHVDSSNNIDLLNNNDNNLKSSFVPYDVTTASSLNDDLYDVDYSDNDDDLTTTVDWQEIERQSSSVHDDTTKHKPESNCNHTAREGCRDPAGRHHEIGSSWRKDACTHCRCYLRGYAECTVTQCSPPMGNIVRCRPPTRGECCPRCEFRSEAPLHGPPSHGHSPPEGGSVKPAALAGPDPESVGGETSGARTSDLLESRDGPGDDGGDGAVKEAVRSDLFSICLVVVGLVGTTSVVGCLAIHYWRRYHSAKYDIAATITAEEAQKLRPVKTTDDFASVTTPFRPSKCV